MSSQFLAVDWGTTNTRAWLVGEDGATSGHMEFALGVGRLAEGEAAERFADTIRVEMGAEDLPAVLCGMIGSNLGIVEAPYVDCPADMAALRRGLCRVQTAGPPVWIVPGLRCTRPDGGPDVMRGEETHVLGWAAADPDRLRGQHLICQPGTHAKWVLLVDGRIERFITSMTGELFDLLRKHSVLRVRDAQDDQAAFDQGVEAAGDGGALASRLFTARARVVGGDMPPGRVESYLSGLLIGAEIASAPALLGVAPQIPVAVVGDPRLSERYLRVLRARGYNASIHDGDAAMLSGLRALSEGALVS